MMQNNDLKLKPYDRLKSILSESNDVKLTNKASEKIDQILGIKKNNTIFDTIKSFFRIK
jgi:hypothetical protein